MDIGRILSRSVEIGWRYRVLWALALIFVLFGGGGGYNPGSSFNYRTSTPISPNFSISESNRQAVGIIILAAVCLGLIWLLLTLYFRFVSRGALVAAVRSIESGAAPTFGSAWREGSRYWARLLGLGLLVSVPLAIVSLLVLAISVLPFLATLGPLISAAMQGGNVPQSEINTLISGVFGFILLFCCALVCIGLLHLLIHPIYQFAVRAIVLEEMGVTAGLARGLQQFRSNLGPAALLYLALIGCRIVFGIAVAVVVIPLALVIGAIVGAAAAQQTGSTIALLVICLSIPLGIIVLLLETLFQVFEQNVWTEGYMALLGNSPVAPASPLPIAPVPPAPLTPTAPPSLQQPPAPSGGV